VDVRKADGLIKAANDLLSSAKALA
jgi:hypothetical protein